MWRVILIFATCLLVADTTGLFPEGDDIECTDDCDGKACPPTCPTCPCAWHSLKTAPPIVIELDPIGWKTGTVENLAPAAAHGRLAPPPTTRPPIA